MAQFRSGQLGKFTPPKSGMISKTQGSDDYSSNNLPFRLTNGLAPYTDIKGIFAAQPNTVGAWWDPYNLSTLKQTSTQTGNVSATNDPVGYMADISGSGNPALQATAGFRPLFKDTGTLRSLVANGVDQFMAAAGVNFTGSTAATIVMGVRQLVANTTAQVIFEAGVPSTAGGGFGAYFNNGSPSGQFGGGCGATGNLQFSGSTGAPGARTFTFALIIKPDAAGVSAQLRTIIDGADITVFSVSSAGAPTSALTFANRTLSLFRREFGTLYANMEFYGGGVINRELTAAELTATMQWCALRTGQPLIDANYEYTPTVFADTRATSQTANYISTSAFAQSEWFTEATSLIATLYTETALNYTEIGATVDGVYKQTIQAKSTPGSHIGTFQMPAGLKRVSFTNGLQTKPAAVLSGTFVTKVRANAPMSAAPPRGDNRILVYGDSISVGDTASFPTQFGVWMRVRQAYYPSSLAVEGWGSRSLFQDCQDAPSRAAFVALLAAYNPTRIWLAIGTNDYGLAKWSAANFGAAYAALLDDLHTAIPGATILCQSPLLRGTETANGFGDTLDAYRTQISTAVSTRGAFSSYVEGKTILALGDLMPDQLHPTTAGHGIYATSAKATLGIP